MKLFPLLLLLVAGPSGPLMGASSPLSEPKWQSLFTGTNLAGWKAAETNPFWSATNGVLVGQNDAALKGNVLFTTNRYGDFALELETRWSGEIDSGVMLRAPELQLQLGVSRSLKKDMTGCFYTGGTVKYPEAGQARNLEGIFRPGEWNKVRLEARGDTFQVWINGVKTTEYTSPGYARPAPLGLQVHPGLKMQVEFRNLRLAELNSK